MLNLLFGSYALTTDEEYLRLVTEACEKEKDHDEESASTNLVADPRQIA